MKAVRFTEPAQAPVVENVPIPFGCAVSTPLWGSRAELMEIVGRAVLVPDLV